MADLSAVFVEFGKFVEQVKLEGRKVSEEDVEYFVERFLDGVQTGFPYGMQYIYTANKQGEDGKPLYDKSKKSYQEMVDEITPVLKARILELEGTLSDSVQPFDWPTKPTTVEEYAREFAVEMKQKEEYNNLSGLDRRNHKAYQRAIRKVGEIKYRIKQYMQTVAPFTARMTMYHPLATVLYSTSTGDSKLVRGITIDSEQVLNDFSTSATVDGSPAADHEGLRSIWWVPSESGKNPKMGVVDIDNPGNNVTQKDLNKAAKKVHKRLSDIGHPAIIMYTGASYQVWFGQSENEMISNYTELKRYLRGLFPDVGTFDRDESIDLELPYLDLATNKANGLIRAFFSLHYPSGPSSKKKYTGLAAVPIDPLDLNTFIPSKHAHPEYVLANFEIYASYVSSFYDKIQVGQDYETPGDTEIKPTCSRLPKRYPNHITITKYLYGDKDLNTIQYANAGEALEGEEKVYAHPLSRGVLAVLVYDPSGSTAPAGMVKQRVVRSGKSSTVVTENAHAYYVTAGGVVIYDDYICRDLERLCAAKNIRTAVLVGRISVLDAFGNEEGENNTRFAMIAKEGLSPMVARQMRFTTSRAPIVDSQEVPIEIMGDQIKEFNTKRIVPTQYFEIEEPVGKKIKQLYSSFVSARKSGAMMVEGKERYLIKSTRSLQGTIVGMDKTGRTYTGSEIPNVYIAVAKPSSKSGMEYLMLGLAQIALKKEDRITLRSIVEGEEGRNLLPTPRARPGLEDIIQFVEPSVVVEISYDDVTPGNMNTIASAFDKNGKFRPITKTLTISHLINAKVVEILEHLDPLRLGDINMSQEKLLQIGKTLSAKQSLLGALPNPGSVLPRFIRRNPAFYGVPETLTITMGGRAVTRPKYDMEGNEVGTFVTHHGGRRIDLPLIAQGPRYDGERLPGELQAAHGRYLKDEPGHQVFVDAKSKQKGSPPHYRVSNLGWEYNIAKDDPYGMGQDGNQIKSFDTQPNNLEQIKSFSEVMEIASGINKQQAQEDMKLYRGTFSIVPGDADSENANYRQFDQDYIQAYKLTNTALKTSLQPVSFSSDEKKSLADSILVNPRPITDDIWQHRVDEYVEDFNKWTALPEPKETWENYAIAKFMSWEVPILEKDRLMRAAFEQYDLTEEQAGAVDLNYREEETAQPFESLLSNIYEVPDDDEETEEIIE